MIQLFLSFIRRLLGCIFGDGEVVSQTAASTVVLEPLAVKEDTDPVRPPSDTQKEEEPPQETNDATSTDPEGGSCSRAFSREIEGGRPRTAMFKGEERRRRKAARGNQRCRVDDNPEAQPSADAVIHNNPEPPPYADAVRHNMHHSFFHRLPLDLLYYLAKHQIHASADLLALSASTRALRFSAMPGAPWLLPPLPRLAPSRDFLKRLRRDDFMRACAAEEAEQQHGELLKQSAVDLDNGRNELLVPCGACQSIHARSLFSDTQLAARTHASRRCKGSTGIVRLCPHATITLAQLSALEAMSPHGVWLSCHECVRPQHVTVLSSTMFRFAPEMEFSVIRFVKVDEDVAADGDSSSSSSSSSSGSSLVAVADAEPHLTPEMTLGVLKAAAERYGIVACNHMRLDDPETFKSNVWTPIRLGGHLVHNSSHGCRIRTCRGYVQAVWWYSRTNSGSFRRDYVRLCVTRFLGQSRSAEDKQWLDQIENLEEM